MNYKGPDTEGGRGRLVENVRRHLRLSHEVKNSILECKRGQ